MIAEGELPERWSLCPLREIADVVMGQSPPGSSYNADGRGLPFFQGKADFGEDHPTPRKWCTEPTRIAEAGDILMSIRAPVGPTNVADRRCAFGRGLASIRSKHGIPASLIRHALRLQEAEIASWGTGTTFTAINKEHFDRIRVPLPPPQLRESIASALDRSVILRRSSSRHLEAARTALDRLRFVVLGAAFSGDLTAEWRVRNPNAKPVPHSAFASIRRNERSVKRTELVIEAPSDRPDSWRSVALGHCVDALDSMRKPVNSTERATRVGEVPYYGATGQVGWIDGALFDEELVLVGEDGAPFLDKSKPIAYIVRGKSWVNNHAHVLRARSAITSNSYLKYFLDWFDFAEYVQGSTRDKLTQGAMNSLPLLLPPLEEQTEIVKRIEELLQAGKRASSRLVISERQITRSEQAILAKAFRGDLNGVGPARLTVKRTVLR